MTKDERNESIGLDSYGENLFQLHRDILCARSELLGRIVARTSHTKLEHERRRNMLDVTKITEKIHVSLRSRSNLITDN